MSDNIEEFFTAALSFAKKAGEIVREKIKLTKNVSLKSCEIDLVTETDQQVEKLLIENLGGRFPDHLFIGEESVADGAQCSLTDQPTWIIDPIDGTMNFVHGFPHSCISIALFIDKLPQVAIVYNPMLEQLFTAKRGQGAFLNGVKIQVSGETNLSNALVMMEFGNSREEEKLNILSKNQETLMELVHGLRSLGSCALDMAMVACGASDAYFEFGIHIWDIAAGELLVTEAGGVCIDPAGGPVDRLSRRVLVASSETLALALSAKLAQYYPQRD